MNALILSILFFLAVSLLLYVLLAGADFGAGILEIFLGSEKREEQRRLIAHAMAPVWEANHVWLILTAVILFMGFPKIYTLLLTYLYIPLMAVLVGIVARGSAFTFRHYDPSKEHYRAYSGVFALSSLWTSFFLGVIAGAVMLGRISINPSDFTSAYVWPWLNWFCLALGVFASALFAFLASVYLVGEAKTNELRQIFRHKAKIGNAIVILAGIMAFASAQLEGFPLFRAFFSNRISLGCFAIATILWIPFWKSLQNMRHTMTLRALAVAIVAAVMLGWLAVNFPVAIQIWDSNAQKKLTFDAIAAPESTLKALLAALIVGAMLIFPALGYLLKVFKWETLERK